jgi:adenylate kinase
MTRVFQLCAPEEVLVQRLLARGREDDTPDVIKERMRRYAAETEPVIDVLRSAGVDIVDVDTSVSRDEVERSIDAALDGEM